MLFKPPKPVGMTLNLAPMVDVMMCLIIFFLLASKLVDAQHRPLNLPYARAALEVGRGELGPRVVTTTRSGPNTSSKPGTDATSPNACSIPMRSGGIFKPAPIRRQRSRQISAA